MRRLIFLVCFWIGFAAHAQDPGSEKASYYIDLNSSSESTVHVVHDEMLAFQYHDAIGQSPNLLVTVRDWQGSIVSRLVLQKTFGLNYYSVPLASLQNATGMVYQCETTTEAGRKLCFYFKKELPAKQELEVSITTDAVNLQCEQPRRGILDFIGSVAQGKLPYTASWFVLTNDQTDLLFLPLEQHLDKQGMLPTLTVDHAPDYYVMLFITDACGNQGKQMVHVVCENGHKRYDTIFLENLPEAVRQQLPTQP